MLHTWECEKIYRHRFLETDLVMSQMLIGCLQVLTSMFIVLFVTVQRLRSHRKTHADFLILPIYFLMLWAFAFADTILGISVALCPIDQKGDAPDRTCRVMVGAGVGLSRATVDGTALLLMTFRAGVRTFRKVGLWSCAWGILCGGCVVTAMEMSAMQWPKWFLMGSNSVLVLAFAVTWLAPPHWVFRRPALVSYSCFWTLTYLLFVACAALLIKQVDVGYCGIMVVWVVCIGIGKPLVLVITLHNDSIFWQGCFRLNTPGIPTYYSNALRRRGLSFGAHKRTQALGFPAIKDAPLLTPSPVCELTDQLDEGELPLINFACLNLGAGKAIGSGGTCKVFTGYMNDKPVAVKMLYTMDLDADSVKRFVHEAKLLAHLRDRHIVEVKGFCIVPPAICVVMELCARGNLHTELSANWASLPWHRRIQMGVDCASAVSFLHQQRPPIIHNDIKSPNFLVDGAGCVKLTDLDFHVRGDSSSNKDFVRVPDACNWTAPEVLERGIVSRASDCYALGMVLWEIATGLVPFDEPQFHTRDQLVESIISGLRPPLHDGIPTELQTLLRRLWNDDPLSRPTAEDVRQQLDRMRFEPWASSAASRPISPRVGIYHHHHLHSPMSSPSSLHSRSLAESPTRSSLGAGFQAVGAVAGSV